MDNEWDNQQQLEWEQHMNESDDSDYNQMMDEYENGLVEESYRRDTYGTGYEDKYKTWLIRMPREEKQPRIDSIPKRDVPSRRHPVRRHPVRSRE